MTIRRGVVWLAVAVLAALAAYVRLAPVDPDRWHVDLGGLAESLAKVPAGYRFAFGIINGSATFGGTATVAIGVAGATGKYRAAAIFTAAAPTLFGVSTAADDDALTAEETVLLTIAAASLPGSGTGYVDLYYSAP